MEVDPQNIYSTNCTKNMQTNNILNNITHLKYKIPNRSVLRSCVRQSSHGKHKYKKNIHKLDIYRSIGIISSQCFIIFTFNIVHRRK